MTGSTPFTSITIDASKNGAGFGADNRFYDNVSFQAVPAVSAAPEPSVRALMLAGVGGIG